MSVIKCKAAVLWRPNEPLSIEEIEVAPPKKDEIRVKILSTCPCHTDVSCMAGKGIGPFGIDMPLILGHESSGIVESIGEGVTEFAVGDMVVPVPIPNCQKCEDCINPKSNNCLYFLENHAKGVMVDGTSRFTCKGQSVYHFLGISSFAEYTVLSTASAAKVISEVPADIASLFGCCFTTGFGSVVNIAKVPSGSTAAVFGLGAIGLSAIMGLKDAGASKIIAVDMLESKLEFAKKLGATHFVNAKTCGDVVKAIEDLNGGVGCDFTFECAGTEATTLNAINASHHRYGVAVILGGKPNSEPISISTDIFVIGRTITGGFVGGVKLRKWVPEVLESYKKSGKFPMKELITHRFKLEQINEAVKTMKEGGVRCAIEF